MGFIEDMKWWHWTALSLVIGAALGFIHSFPAEPPAAHRAMDAMSFEDRLLRAPLVDSRNGHQYFWVTNIVVYPPVLMDEHDTTVQGQMVTFSGLEMPDGASPLARIAPYATFMPYPYEPSPHNDADENDKYPGVVVYMGRANDTIESVMTKFYGKVTPEGRRAIIGANKVFRNAKSIKDVVIQPDQAYFIPWNPTEMHTFTDFLDAAAKEGTAAGYRYAWWYTPKYAYEIWITGSLIVLGVIWPALIQMMIKNGFGRPKRPDAEYDLKRFKHAPEPKKAAAVKPAVTAADIEQLETLQQRLTASVKAGRDQLPQGAAGGKPGTAAVKPLGGGADGAGAVPAQTEEEKSYGGEYYPVVRPAPTKDDKKGK